MNKTKFTPGSWIIKNISFDDQSLYLFDENDIMVTKINNLNKNYKNLILAAPELYNTLEEFKKFAVKNIKPEIIFRSEAFKKAIKTLDKARGEK